MIVNTAPGTARPQSLRPTVRSLGETLNTAANSVYGPVNPLGITDRVITGANDTFTLAVNDGAPTVIEVAAGTYAMEELATAVQTAIDSSPFSSTGTFPITVGATTDENGDWGLTFGSADGHSIQVGGTSFLTDVLALSVADPSSAPILTSRTRGPARPTLTPVRTGSPLPAMATARATRSSITKC